MDTSFELKSPQKNAGVPPCISCFFGARFLGRVLATLPYVALYVATFFPDSDAQACFFTLTTKMCFSKNTTLKKWRAFRPAFHVFGVLEF